MRRTILALSALLLMFWQAPQLILADESHGHAHTASAKTLQGELIDMHCYTTGQAHGKDHASCAKECAESGIPLGVLVSPDKAYTLLTNPKPLAKYAARMVRISGEVSDKTMTIAPDKIEVQEGETWKELKLEDAHHK